MLLVGLFKTNTGLDYTIHKLITENSIRLEILEKGALFHEHYNKVLYSIYISKNKCYTLGNKKLYESFKSLFIGIKNCNIISKDLSIYWQNNNKKRIPELILTVELENGNCYTIKYLGDEFFSEEIKFNRNFIYLKNSNLNMDDEIAPINLIDYKVKTSNGRHLKDFKKSIDLSLFYLDKLYKNYKIIKSLEDADKCLKSITNNSVVSIFFLTFIKSHKIAGIGISPQAGVSYYFPFENYFYKLPHTYIYNIKNYLRKSKVVVYDLKHIITIMLNNNIYFPVYNDIMILHGSLNSNFYINEEYYQNLKWNHLESSKVLSKSNYLNSNNISLERIIMYICPASDYILNTYNKFSLGETDTSSLESSFLEMRLVQNYYINNNINSEELKRIIKYYSYLYNYIKHLIDEALGENVDLSSKIKIEKLVFNVMKYPRLKDDNGEYLNYIEVINKLSQKWINKDREIVKKDIIDKDGQVIIDKDLLNKSEYVLAVLLNKYFYYLNLYKKYKQIKNFIESWPNSFEKLNVNDFPEYLLYKLLIPDSVNYKFIIIKIKVSQPTDLKKIYLQQSLLYDPTKSLTDIVSLVIYKNILNKAYNLFTDNIDKRLCRIIYFNDYKIIITCYKFIDFADLIKLISKEIKKYFNLELEFRICDSLKSYI